jgi:hypothetical protein
MTNVSTQVFDTTFVAGAAAMLNNLFDILTISYPIHTNRPSLPEGRKAT